MHLAFRSTRFAVWLFWLVGLWACGSIRTSYVQINTPPRSMKTKDAGAVEVLTVPPSRTYVEVGTVQMLDSGPGDGDVELTAALRHEAARQGCDAIVVHTRDFGDGVVMVNSAACLVYTDGSPRS